MIKTRKKNLPDDRRFGIYLALKALTQDREVLPSDKELVACLMNTNVRTIERIWKKANERILRGEEVDVFNKKKGRSGHKRKDLGLSRIPTIPYKKRSTMRSLGMSLNVSIQHSSEGSNGATYKHCIALSQARQQNRQAQVLHLNARSSNTITCYAYLQ